MIDAIRSEWIKVSTITVTWVLVLVAVAFPLVITVLTAAFEGGSSDGADFAGLISGTAVVSSMLLGVVATLGITNEFSHNTIRPTFAALPDRTRALLAKPIVHVAVSLLVTVVIVIVGWVVGTAIAEGTQELSDDGAMAALVGVVFLAIGLTLLGYGLGMLVRNSAAAICLLLLWPLVAEGLIAGLMAAAGVEGLQRWLPYVAGITMASPDIGSDSLGRVSGGLYFFAWVLVVVGLGIWSTKRRDA